MVKINNTNTDMKLKTLILTTDGVYKTTKATKSIRKSAKAQGSLKQEASKVAINKN